MFDQSVQSTAGDTAKQGAYLGITTLIYALILTAAMVWSVFSFDLSNLNDGNLAYNELVAPVVVPENVLPPVVPDTPQPRVAAATNNKRNFDVIKDPVRDIDSSTDSPEKILTEKSTATAVRDKVAFVTGDINLRATGDNDSPIRGEVNNGSNAAIISDKPTQIEDSGVAPPVVTPKSKDLPVVKKDVTISKGVINGSATSLPKPAYPPAARQMRAGGEVKVQVLIDERGNVVSATAVSGHPLLRAAAQAAARNAKFTPTQLSKQPVKVNGVIVYNFVTQ